MIVDLMSRPAEPDPIHRVRNLQRWQRIAMDGAKLHGKPHEPRPDQHEHDDRDDFDRHGALTWLPGRSTRLRFGPTSTTPEPTTPLHEHSLSLMAAVLANMFALGKL